MCLFYLLSVILPVGGKYVLLTKRFSLTLYKSVVICVARDLTINYYVWSRLDCQIGTGYTTSLTSQSCTLKSKIQGVWQKQEDQSSLRNFDCLSRVALYSHKYKNTNTIQKTNTKFLFTLDKNNWVAKSKQKWNGYASEHSVGHCFCLSTKANGLRMSSDQAVSSVDPLCVRLKQKNQLILLTFNKTCC